MNKSVICKDLGTVPYQEAWKFQEEELGKIVDIKLSNRKSSPPKDTPNYLYFVEHPLVFTLGKTGDINHLLLNKTQLEEKGITFCQTNRGGDITHHGPGQLVGYPILDLENFFTDIHLYLRKLEDCIIEVIAHYGLNGERSKGETGVWLDPETIGARKICAMGIRASRWVTMHGFALNINNPLSYFDMIIPCGIRGKAVTSIEKELGQKVDIEEVKNHFIQAFEKHFEAKIKVE